MNRPALTRLLSLLPLGFASIAIPLQASPAHPCAQIQDGSARLACYDRAFPPVRGSTSVPDVEAERARAKATFGLNGQQRRELDPEHESTISPDSIASTVRRVDYTGEGVRIVTLANGQVWRLLENTSKGRLAADDQVTVRKAALGSFMLVTPRGIALRARRTR